MALYDGRVQLWDADGTPLRTLQVTERIAGGGSPLVFRAEPPCGAPPMPRWCLPTAKAKPAKRPNQPKPPNPPRNPAGPRPGEVSGVVGISNYKFVSASLTYAFSDARKVAAALKDPSKGNLPLDQVLLHGDDEATKNVIEADLCELARRMKAGDTLVFYFSGHRMPGSDGQAKLIPADAKPNDEETWLSVAERKDQDQKPSSCIFPLPASPFPPTVSQ